MSLCLQNKRQPSRRRKPPESTQRHTPEAGGEVKLLLMAASDNDNLMESSASGYYFWGFFPDPSLGLHSPNMCGAIIIFMWASLRNFWCENFFASSEGLIGWVTLQLPSDGAAHQESLPFLSGFSSLPTRKAKKVPLTIMVIDFYRT